MKIVKLFFDELKSFILQKFGVFVILILGITLSFYSFNLMYGSILYTIKGFYNYNYYNTYTLEFSKQNNYNINTIIEKLKQKGLRTALLMSIEKDSPMLIGWYGENNNRWFLQNQGEFLSKANIENADNVAIIADVMYSYPDVNYNKNPYYYKNGEYKILGLLSTTNNGIFFNGHNNLFNKYFPMQQINEIANESHDHEDEHFINEEVGMKNPYIDKTIIIPYTTFINSNENIHVLRVEFTIDSASKRAIIQKELELLFPKEIVLPPELADYSYTREMIFSLMKSVAICIVSFLNIVGLFIYWRNSRIKTYHIYHLTGGKNITILSLSLFCWMVLMLISILFSRFIMNITKPILSLLDISTELTFQQTAIVYLCGLCVSFIISAPYIIKKRG